MEEKKLLTPLELKVMKILWQLKNAFVKDIIEQWPEKAQPKYNTVSTVVRILEEKGFVDHESFGRSHRYFPVLSKGRYQQRLMGNVLDNVFSGSLTGLVSSLLNSKDLSENELEDLRKLIDEDREE